LNRLPAGVLVLNQGRNVQRPLAAFADIVIDMAIPRGQAPSRRRTFSGVGRYPDTLQAASAELNAEGTDYLLVPGSTPPHPPLFATLHALLRASPVPLTRRELLEGWPGPPPRPDTLWRALDARRRARPHRRAGRRHEDGRVSLRPGEPDRSAGSPGVTRVPARGGLGDLPARALDGKSEQIVLPPCLLCYNGRAFGNPKGPSSLR
jgi:hypothetical protein